MYEVVDVKGQLVEEGGTVGCWDYADMSKF